MHAYIIVTCVAHCFIVLVTCHCYNFAQHYAPHQGRLIQCYVFMLHFLYPCFAIAWMLQLIWNWAIICVSVDFGRFGRCPSIIRNQNTLVLVLFYNAATSYFTSLWKENFIRWIQMGKGWNIKIWYFQKTDFFVPSSFNLVLCVCLFNIALLSKLSMS